MHANHAGHVVKRETLLAADGGLFVVVLPRSQQEELTTGASLHALTARFGEVGEAVLLKDNKGQAFFERGSHNMFLARGNAGRYQDGSFAG